jgi:holin-like protein
LKKLLFTVCQVIFFMVISQVMNALAHHLLLPVPGSILGIICIFILLQTKVIQLDWIDSGAKWLLAETLLFFIPSSVGVVPYKSLLLGSGLQIVLVILCSTATVMVFTGKMAQGLARIKERKQE